jgi:hypothetical protein
MTAMLESERIRGKSAAAGMPVWRCRRRRNSPAASSRDVSERSGAESPMPPIASSAAASKPAIVSSAASMARARGDLIVISRRRRVEGEK